MSKKFLSNRMLIAMLKKQKVKKLVLSPGTRNIPFVNAVENDENFECFSVIDERNAAFFGLGLSQQSREQVAIVCTSGTAASNYLPGVTEAFYSHVPLIVITFDRSPYALNQLETQKINQPAIFTSVCKKSVSLPVIKDDDDIWYCQRLLNEAFIALNQHQLGPIHINIPIIGDTNKIILESMAYNRLDKVNKIEYIPINASWQWEKMAKRLYKAKKVLVVMGQTSFVSNQEKEIFDIFFHRLHCPLLADNLCNYDCDEKISSEPVIKALNAETISSLLPEIVITFGADFQERTKDLLKAHQGKFEHWSIEPEGLVKDVFKSETALFECTPYEFFYYFGLHAEENQIYSSKYLASWRELEQSIHLPEVPFTNFYVVQEFSKVIPSNSILHLSILNSTRLMQFFHLDSSIKVYSNVNAYGIDGCLPTFMGQACATSKIAFLVIGDLSFFYGMNALSIKHKKNNIRVLLINNGGGAEFHINPDENVLSTIDLHIGAAHDRTAKGWAESAGYEYLKAYDKNSFMENLNIFVDSNHDKPVLLEVFTKMKKDGETCLFVYRELEKCILPIIEKRGIEL